MFNINIEMEKTSLYNIGDYTDEELFEILDLNNPTDKELEAKILMMIHKYESLNTKAGKKLSTFFEKIYDRFFESEDEDENENIQEGFEVGVEENMDEFADEFVDDLVDEEIIEDDQAESRKEEIKEELKNEQEKEKTFNVKPINYISGKLNPIKRETTKKIIQIDSSLRTDKEAMSSSFTCTLSEPLKDVISLKFYSYTIPTSFYLVKNTFGSNFFKFKGVTEGINNSNHDIKIEIDSQKYDNGAEDVVTAVNNVIDLSNSQIDASLNVSFYFNRNNSSTQKTEFEGSIDKRYNESSYYLQFEKWESPNVTDRTTTIPSYLGFMSQINYINVLKSVATTEYLFPATTAAADTTNYVITDLNNKVIIYQYYNSFPYDPNNSIIDVSRQIVVDAGSYTRSSLTTQFNNKLSEDSYLTDSYLKRVDIDAGNNINNSIVELKAKFSRTVAYTAQTDETPTLNILYPNVESRTLVILPDDSEIWIGENSCFKFDSSYNELNTIFSDISAVEQNDSFTISDNPYIELKSIAPNFITTVNDISFALDNGTYLLNEYISKINESIRTYDANNNNILNAPSADYTFDATTNTYPTGTFSYLRNNVFHLHLDIDNSFNETMYQIDLTGSDVFTTGRIELKDPNGADVGTDITDLTQTYTATTGSTAISMALTDQTSTSPLVCKIKPITTSSPENGNESDVTYEIRLDSSIAGTNQLYTNLETLVNTAFSSFSDPLTGLNIFEGTQLTSQFSSEYRISFEIRIVKKLLTNNYQVKFIDTNNSWGNFLKIDDSMIDQYFNLSYNIPTTTATIVTNTTGEEIAEINTLGDIEITGNREMALTNTITIIEGDNDTLNFVAYDDGVTSTVGANNFSLIVDPGQYSVATLIEKLNNLFSLQAGVVDVANSIISVVDRAGTSNFVSISNSIKRVYTINDYNIAFYDDLDAGCSPGSSGTEITTWDTTIGWIMGFRKFTVYDLATEITVNSQSIITVNTTNKTVTVFGDTVGITSNNLYNNFFICVDDFNQSRLSDGLVTIQSTDTDIRLPSYASRAGFICDPVTGQKVYANNEGLTANQLYGVNAINNSQSDTTAIGTSIQTSSYSKGPFASDVFGTLSATGGSGGRLHVAGGTLMSQERVYFGPVNLRKMNIKLISDKGDLVDLNGENWSFTMISEQLYNNE
tara:strand:- start:7416 stop:10916 length:3501 start_codon:yes stop_codon:yes gene_type:complete